MFTFYLFFPFYPFTSSVNEMLPSFASVQHSHILEMASFHYRLAVWKQQVF